MKKFIPLLFSVVVIVGIMAFAAPTSAQAQESCFENTQQNICFEAYYHSNQDVDQAAYDTNIVSPENWCSQFLISLVQAKAVRYVAAWFSWLVNDITTGQFNGYWDYYKYQVSSMIDSACGEEMRQAYLNA